MDEIALSQFVERVDFTESGCWLWLGHRRGNGYGGFKDDYAHRWSYRTMVGPIPAGMEIDHLCRVRMCVNPWHLEPVTRLENTMRGLLPQVQRARHARKTHCPQGHAYNDENTYQRSDRPCGGRLCKECNRTRQRVRRMAATA